MKKILVLLLILSLVFSMVLALGSCKPKNPNDGPTDEPGNTDDPSTGDDPVDDPADVIGDPTNGGTGIELPPIEVESNNNQTNQEIEGETEGE